MARIYETNKLKCFLVCHSMYDNIFFVIEIFDFDFDNSYC